MRGEKRGFLTYKILPKISSHRELLIGTIIVQITRKIYTDFMTLRFYMNNPRVLKNRKVVQKYVYIYDMYVSNEKVYFDFLRIFYKPI